MLQAEGVSSTFVGVTDVSVQGFGEVFIGIPALDP